MRIPQGFGVVSPYVFANDAEGYIGFLSQAFGAVERLRSLTPDGRIANSQLDFSGARIMISEASPAFPATRSAFYLYVADADVAMRQAIGAGAILIMAVADMPYDDRQGGVRDPWGNIWWVSQRLTDAPY